MSEPQRFDVVVLGSGFGGSLLATILCRQGIRVAMVDRDRHPRFAIGESSTPIADLLLEQLATRYGLDEVQRLTRFGTWRRAYPDLVCGCKRGFSYFCHSEPGGFVATADHRHELLVAANASRDVADTQWYRPHVDHFLATVAKQRGVITFAAAEVVAIDHRSPHAWNVAVECDGAAQRLQARFLVDASGPAGVLMRTLPVEDWTSLLQTCSSAVFGHWLNVPPLSAWLADRRAVAQDYPYPVWDSVIHHLFADGWLWQIPFENGLTSLGFVRAGEPRNETAAPPEQVWESVVQRHAVLGDILGRPRPAPFPGQLFATGRLQRLRSSAAGEDWAALPFTVGFVDPLHSTGIAHTLHAVERLGRILADDVSHARDEALSEYGEAIVRELRHVDRLVSGCYAALGDFRLFTTWSMIYFAAATTMEEQLATRARGLVTGEHGADSETGFLGADDSQFCAIVDELARELRKTDRASTERGSQTISTFCDRVRDALAPYNHVGLFEPAVANMYRYTAAEK